MSKRVLIVEGDPSVSSEIKASLESRGFLVDETQDAKGVLEAIRAEKPNLVLLAVELGAGQNGYLSCGKIKKDDELKSIPVVIIGSPEGFSQHKKLKTRADEYVAKPIDAEELLAKISSLIGLPETSAVEVVDESLTLSDLVEDEPPPAAIDGGASPAGGDPDLEMLDAAFEQISVDGQMGATETEAPVEAPPESAEELAEAALDSLEAPDLSLDAGAALDQLDGEASVSEVPIEIDEVALDDLDDETPLSAEPVAAPDPEPAPAIRNGFGARDKEILKLKDELHRRDQEIIDLREREVKLEQELAHGSGELARRDAQLKTTTARADQLAAERRKIDQQLSAARADLRSKQAEAQKALGDVERLEGELEHLRSEAQNARREAEDARGELESVKAQLARQSEDGANLRQKTAELEVAISKHEQRLATFYQRFKEHEKIREKTKKALSIALQLLDEQQRTKLELGDEPAEA